MNEHEVRQAIREILNTGPEFKMRDDVTDTDLLRESGVMDSFDQIAFVVRLEEHFSIQMDPEDLEEDAFRSIASVAVLIVAKGAA